MSDLERIRPELVLGHRPPEVEPELAAAREAWAEIVGADAATSSYPTRISGDAIVVVCASAPWAGELGMLRRDLEARMERLTGHPLALRFEIGDVPETPTS